MFTRMASVRLQTLSLRILHFAVILAMVLPNGAIFTRSAQAASVDKISEEIPTPTNTITAEKTPDPLIGAGELITPTETISITPTATLSPTLELVTEEPTQEPDEEVATPTVTYTATEIALEPTVIITPTITLEPTKTVTPTVTLTPTLTVTPTPTITATQTVTKTDIFTVSQIAPVALPLRGGKVVGFGGAVTVTFPTQSEKLSVWIRTPIRESAPPTTLSGNSIEILAQKMDNGVEVTKFTTPLTISVAYDEEALWGSEDGLVLKYYDTEKQTWVNISSWVDTDKNVLYGRTSHLTVFDYTIETIETARIPSLANFQAAQFTGAGTYSMDFWTPPGPGGLQPEFTLSYNSQTVDSAKNTTQGSWVGMGWSLDTGYIERNTYGTDNKESDDTFSIVVGGMSSMLLKHENYESNGLYRTADENFWRIKYESANERWIAWDKTGNKYTFGHVARYKRIHGKGEGNLIVCNVNWNEPWRWSLTEVKNIYGKSLTYTYDVDVKDFSGCNEGLGNYEGDMAVYPKYITYPNNLYRVRFVLENRSDYDTDWTYQESPVLYQLRRLNYILIEHDADFDGFESGEWIRKYDFTYDSSNPIFPKFTWNTGGYTSALLSVKEYGASGASLPATTFSYSDHMHLTAVNNGYGGRTVFSYEPWNELKGDSTRHYSITRFCDNGVIKGWTGHANPYDIDCQNHYINFEGQIEHALPEYFYMYGVSYKVYARAANDGGTWISAGLSYYTNTTTTEEQWTEQTTMPTTMDTDFVGEFTIPADAEDEDLGGKILLNSIGAQMQEYSIYMLPIHYRVVTKTIYSTSDDTSGDMTIYRYDEPAMNDTDHSTAAGYENPYIEEYQEFRGHAMVQEIGPAGSDGSQRVTTTYFHQDDVKKGKNNTTLVTSQSFFDYKQLAIYQQWRFNNC